MSIGCITEVESAEARPPAKADFRTFSADICTGGGMATTVAASNQMLLDMILNDQITQQREYSIQK